jgi:hypothetical protein
VDLLLGVSSSSADGLMAVSRAVAPLSSNMRNGKWYSAAAEPCSNDADYEKFSSDAARSHVTVRGFACLAMHGLILTWNGFCYL